MSEGEQTAGRGTDGSPAGSKAGGQDALKLDTEEMIKRRSRWQSSLSALRYVSSVAQDDDVRLRDSDRATSLWLLLVCIFAFLSLVLPQLASPDQPPALYKFLMWMLSLRLPLVLSADVLVGFGLLLYVTNRFGIVTTLTPRQALLAWHLMLGASLLGIFLSINLALIIWVVVSHTQIVIPEAHPQIGRAGIAPQAPPADQK